MFFVTLVTILTTILSVAVKVIGIPAQIRANRMRKSTEGLSGWFLYCTLISYAMWVVHGLQVGDMSLVIGQGLGVIATGMIIYQMIIYRQKRTAKFSVKPTLLWYSAMLAKSRARLGGEKVQ